MFFIGSFVRMLRNYARRGYLPVGLHLEISFSVTIASFQELGQVSLTLGFPSHPAKLLDRIYRLQTNLMLSSYVPGVQPVAREPFVLPEDFLHTAYVVADIIIDEICT